MDDTTFAIWPWQKGEKPYFTNEEGFDWYVDKSLTDWANSPNPSTHVKSLNAVCFIVVKDGKPQTRLLIDADTNQILADETSIEGMGAKIDILRVAKSMS